MYSNKLRLKHEFWTTLDEDDDEDEFDVLDAAGDPVLLK